MIKDFFMEKRPHNGLTYEEFSNTLQKEIDETNTELLSDEEISLFEYTKLNMHRSNRIHKTYKPSDELKSVIHEINEKQIWMVITEGWCGDSAQNLPYIEMISQLNDNIDLRIILRDDNLDIMDQYLTNGTSRSIPKLVAFDESGNELFQWGPRPAEAQQLVNDLKSAGMQKKELTEKLHLWYGRNRCKVIEVEFISLIYQHLKEKKELCEND